MKRKAPEYHAYVYVYSTLCKSLDVHKLEPRRSWPCRDADSLCPPPCAQASRLVVGGDTGRNGPRARVREWLAWHSMASHAPNISRRSGSNYFIIADHGSWCERLASSAPLQGKTPRNLSSTRHWAGLHVVWVHTSLARRQASCIRPWEGAAFAMLASASCRPKGRPSQWLRRRAE